MNLIIEIQGVDKHFGGVSAISDLRFDLKQGEILGLIGPNGAGKTTLFNTITGFFAPDRGTILFKGKRIDGLRPHQIVAKGIARTFQHTNLFTGGTTVWNIMAGFHRHTEAGFFQILFNTKSYRREEDMIRTESVEILNSMGLGEWAETMAENLPHGPKRALGVCLALATSPEVLLLDEPATGLTEEERLIFMGKIKGIRDRGISIILVEHNMEVVMGICDRIVVMNFGTKIAEGTPREIMTNETVVEAYLGRE
ncbi:MAG: ABC transporter ATP-binding protein [Thermodesulfobacteriota bacterium]